MIHTSASCINFLGNEEVQFEGVFCPLNTQFKTCKFLIVIIFSIETIIALFYNKSILNKSLIMA